MHPFCHLLYNLDSFLYLLQCKCYTTYQLLGCNGYGVIKRKKKVGGAVQPQLQRYRSSLKMGCLRGKSVHMADSPCQHPTLGGTTLQLMNQQRLVTGRKHSPQSINAWQTCIVLIVWLLSSASAYSDSFPVLASLFY